MGSIKDILVFKPSEARARCKLGVGVVNHIFLHLYGHFITTARSKSNDKMLLILCFLSPLHAYCRLFTALPSPPTPTYLTEAHSKIQDVILCLCWR